MAEYLSPEQEAARPKLLALLRHQPARQAMLSLLAYIRRVDQERAELREKVARLQSERDQLLRVAMER